MIITKKLMIVLMLVELKVGITQLSRKKITDEYLPIFKIKYHIYQLIISINVMLSNQTKNLIKC